MPYLAPLLFVGASHSLWPYVFRLNGASKSGLYYADGETSEMGFDQIHDIVPTDSLTSHNESDRAWRDYALASVGRGSLNLRTKNSVSQIARKG
jgi:hypothetical protein